MSLNPFHDLEMQGFRIGSVDMDRLEELVALFNRCSQRMFGKNEFTVAEYIVEYEEPGFNLAEDTRVVFAKNDAPVGVVEVWDTGEIPVHPYIWGRVDPEWENRGIGTAMMTWALRRTEKSLQRVPAHMRVSSFSSVPGNYEPGLKLLENLGMRPARRYWQMVIDLDEAPPAPEWPQEISLRPFDLERDAESVYRAEEESFRDHWGFVEQPFETGFAQWKHHAFNNPEYDPALWFIAMDGEEIAGLARTKAATSQDPDMGWVSILAVRRPWRRQGLGLALLRHAFGVFYRMGKARGGLGVDSGNLTGATSLYTNAGMHVSRVTTSFEFELRPGEEIMTQST